jgi:hypothetical protein
MNGDRFDIICLSGSLSLLRSLSSDSDSEPSMLPIIMQ